MRTLIVLCFALSLVSVAGAQERVRPSSGAKPRVDANAPDPFSRVRVSGRVMVGDHAPNFELTSSDGHDVALNKLRGDWLLLRFADGRAEFADLAPMKDQLEKIGVRMIGICGDKPQTLRAFVQRQSLPFEILSDASGEVAAMYGFYDPTTLSGRTGMVIVDRRGVVRMALQGGAPAEQVVELARYTVTAFSPSLEGSR